MSQKGSVNQAITLVNNALHHLDRDISDKGFKQRNKTGFAVFRRNGERSLQEVQDAFQGHSP